MRFNDGAVDSQGRFWAGSSIDHKYVTGQHEGVLYRLDPDRSVHTVLKGMTTPNGMGWNAADDTMYITDSPHGAIYAYDFEAATGSIANRRVFLRLERSVGEPDGFAMDVEGCLWVAVWRGGCVLRVTPAGAVVGEVALPTRFVTCAEFVGSTLFVTTAMEQEPYAYPESARHGGKVYCVDVGVQGKPRNAFGAAT
jgi:sugar lactone lactonase YvrE